MTAIIGNLEKDRSFLIKALQMVQEKEGYVSDAAVKEIAQYFEVAPIEVEGILTFYAQFKRAKPGKFIISVCDGTACHIKGASLVSNWISDDIGIKSGETDGQGLFSLETVACLGCCSLAPVVGVNGKIFGNLTRKSLMRVLRTYKKEAMQ